MKPYQDTRLWWPTVVSSVLLLVSTFVVLSEPAGAIDPYSCTVETVGADAVLSFAGDRATSENVRRGAGWEATVTSLESHVAVGGAGDAFVVRLRGPQYNSPFATVTCTDAVPSPTTTTTTAPNTTTTTTIGPTTTTTTIAPPPAGYACSFVATPVDVTLSFSGPRGDTEHLRRNGSWAGEVTGLTSKVIAFGAGDTYSVRVRGPQFANPFEEVSCPAVSPPPPPPGPASVDIVLHISIDGLRSDRITPALTPNLAALVSQGASTLNARSDSASTKTLPNHHSQLTGRPLLGAAGHDVGFNEDMGTTVHQEHGSYVASVFDVVHDYGRTTSAFVSKAKFDMFDRNWDEVNGAPDLVGADDGRDKIDNYLRSDPATVAQAAIDQLATGDDGYIFLHLRSPDESGHASSWGSASYDAAVASSDALVGLIMTEITTNPVLADRVGVVVVADHGGPIGGLFHSNASLEGNYTIPMILWGPGTGDSTDLYDLNVGIRTDPGVGQVPAIGGLPTEPIRGHDVANIALDLLGFPPVPGSSYNAATDLILE